MKPDQTILDAFNLNEIALPLLGGQNSSWKVGGYVLKYVGRESNTEWISSTLAQLKPDHYRISTPVKSNQNDFVFDGWTCSKFEEGTFVTGHEKQKLETSRLFHRSLADINLSGYRPANDRWQLAHRVALAKESLPLGINRQASDYIEGLFKMIYNPGVYSTQLVHGDLAGNILFHDQLPPLVIDFSPTIACVEYAEAILIADSIAWYNAPIDTISLVPQNEHYREMLLRAVIFRLAVAAIRSEGDEFIETLEAFRVIINEVGR